MSARENLPDSAWFRSHLESLLRRWWQASVNETGLFLTELDREWRRKGGGVGTLVSQNRLIFNFATGWRLLGHAAYRTAALEGARFLAARFLDREQGGCFWACDTRGAVQSDRKDAYGNAFALFGLAHALGASGGDLVFQEAVFNVWEAMRLHFTDSHGGLIPGFTRDFRDPASHRSQNPVMHLFEALLALAETGGMPAFLEEAERIAQFVFTRLARQDGALPEVFNADWEPLPVAEGGRIDIGHQFEWAYLLSRGVEIGLPESWLAPAARLLDYGLKIGYDVEEGGVFSPATPEDEVVSRHKSWWEQCEAARAILHFARQRSRQELLPLFTRTVALMQNRFIDPVHGGWFMRVEPDGTVPDTDKGTTWKVDYHVVGLCAEAMRYEEAL